MCFDTLVRTDICELIFAVALIEAHAVHDIFAFDGDLPAVMHGLFV